MRVRDVHCKESFTLVGIGSNLSVEIVNVIVVAGVEGLGRHHLRDQLVEVNLLVDWSRAPPKDFIANSVTSCQIPRDDWEHLVTHLWHDLGADPEWLVCEAEHDADDVGNSQQSLLKEIPLK